MDEDQERFDDVACKRYGWGINVGETRIGVLAFADNFWIVAHNPQVLEKMTRSFVNWIHMSGWKIPLEEATWATTIQDNIEAKIEVGILLYGELPELTASRFWAPR